MVILYIIFMKLTADEIVRGLVTLNAVDMADVDAAGNLTTHMAAMGNQLKVYKLLLLIKYCRR